MHSPQSPPFYLASHRIIMHDELVVSLHFVSFRLIDCYVGYNSQNHHMFIRDAVVEGSRNVSFQLCKWK